jgi:hypothetical protein
VASKFVASAGVRHSGGTSWAEREKTEQRRSRVKKKCCLITGGL